jgi:hypothetical protein
MAKIKKKKRAIAKKKPEKKSILNMSKEKFDYLMARIASI